MVRPPICTIARPKSATTASEAANAAVIDAMENGLATSSTIIVPGPWFPEIAAYAKSHPNSDFGVHIAHTSEWKTLKWGPIANKSDVPGLVDPQGYLWPDINSVYKNSSPEQAYIEAKAQIKKALDAGIGVRKERRLGPVVDTRVLTCRRAGTAHGDC